MPLIIHPESSCDVCLESLTYDDPTPPYAIPCGHIFCRACLVRTDPRNCPLCRKPYAPERAKKLITGERPISEDAGEAVENNLLRRLIVSWDIQEEQLLLLLTEVDGWLSSRAEIQHVPLRKAREALRTYQKLKSQTEDNRRTIKHLKHALRRQEYATSLDKDTAHAVEESLLGQVEELHTKVARHEAEIEKLLLEISTFKNSKNPLPAPPQPFVLDGVPPSLIPGVSGHNLYNWNSAQGPSSLYTTNGNDTTVVPQPRSRSPINEDRHRSHPHGREARHKDRKGKQRAREDRDRQQSTYRSSPSVLRPLPIPNEAEPAIANIDAGDKNTIIPGATPTQRVIPKSAFDGPNLEGFMGYESPVDPRDVNPLGLDLHFDQNPDEWIDPYTLTAGVLNEYANGYGVGYHAATSLHPSRTRGETSAPGSVHSFLLEPPAPRGQSGHRIASRRPADPPSSGAIPLAQPAPSVRDVIAEETARPLPRWGESVPPQNHPTLPPSNLVYVAPTAVEVPIVPQEASGVPPPPLVSPPVIQPSTAPPLQNRDHDRSMTAAFDSSSRPSNHRRRTVQVDGNLTDSASMERAPLQISGRSSEAPIARHPGLHRRSAIYATIPAPNGNPTPSGGSAARPESHSSSNTARSSLSSWGTVASQGAGSVAHTIHSMADLPLTTFEDGAGARGSLHSESSLVSFSRGNPFQSHGLDEEEHVDRRDNTTPRNRTTSFSASVSTLRADTVNSQSTERPRDRHHGSYPASPSHIAQSSRYSHNSMLSGPPAEHITSAGHRHRTNRQRMTSGAPTPATNNPGHHEARVNTSIDTALWTDASHLTEAPTENALGLQLDHTHITAPTPIVSSRAFLRSFSHDYGYGNYV